MSTRAKKFQFTRFDMDLLKSFELIKQGAEAKVYIGKHEEQPELILAKERFKKTYRHPELDKSLTSKRIKNEVKILGKANLLNVNVPKVLKADLNNGVICMEYIQNSVTCREFILGLVKENQEDYYKPILDDLSVRIGQLVGKLHLNEIIHGDLTTSNLLVVESSNSSNAQEKLKLYFIDFGLGSISNQLEEKAVDLYVLERALLSTHSQQAQQMFEGILSGYLIGHEKESDKVIERFEQVRMRGRKRTMIG